MFIKSRHFKGKANLYFCLQESYRGADGKPKTRHIAYLGVQPVKKLKKLMQEGLLTEDQVAEITFQNDFSIAGYELETYLEKLKKYLLPMMHKGIMAGYAQKEPSSGEVGGRKARHLRT